MKINYNLIAVITVASVVVNVVQSAGHQCDKFCKRNKRKALKRSVESHPIINDNYEVILNRILYGRTALSVPNSNVVDCAKACLADNTCYSYEVHKHRGTCYGNVGPMLSPDENPETSLNQYYATVLKRNRKYVFFRRKIEMLDSSMDDLSKRGAPYLSPPRITHKALSHEKIFLSWKWPSLFTPTQINVMYVSEVKAWQKNFMPTSTKEGGTAILTDRTTNVTLKRLSEGGCYNVHVTFVTASDETGNVTSEVNACTGLRPPLKPQIENISDSSYVLKWMPHNYDEGTTIDVSWMTLGGPRGLSRQSRKVPRDSTSFRLFDLDPNTNYLIQLQAVKSGAVSTRRSLHFKTSDFVKIESEGGFDVGNWQTTPLPTTTTVGEEETTTMEPPPPIPPSHRQTRPHKVARTTTTTERPTTTRTTTSTPKPTTTTPRPTTTTIARPRKTTARPWWLRKTTTPTAKPTTTVRPWWLRKTTTTTAKPTTTTTTTTKRTTTPTTTTTTTTPTTTTTTTTRKTTTTTRPTTTTTTTARPTTTTTTTTTQSTTTKTVACEMVANEAGFIDEVVASSEYQSYTADHVHLDDYGWMPKLSNDNQFINVSFSKVVPVKGIATAGVTRWFNAYYVTEFEVHYSMSSTSEIFEHKTILTDVANSASDPKRVDFPEVFFARRMSFRPVKWNNEIAVRIDIILSC